MASGMKQDKVVESVAAAMHAPDDMVSVPSSLNAYRLTAARTSASLSSPEPPSSTIHGLAHAALFALFKVELPFRVERVGLGLDLNVASDGNRADINQLEPPALSLGILHLRRKRPALERGYPVASGQPFLALVRMAS